jgi:hypothetical protein
MTSEIAVMNKSAIALAADSAVTITTADGNKTYNTVNKLFVLSKYRPIGIMIYGRTELNGVPWETLIKTYRQKLSTEHFSTVAEYAKHFLDHLGQSIRLFPESEQIEYVEFTAAIEFLVLRDFITDALAKASAASSTKLTNAQVEAITAGEISDRLRNLEGLPHVTSVPSGMEAVIPNKYRATINKVVLRVFKNIPLTSSALTNLDSIVARRFTRDTFPEGQHTGVVVAGFGDNEIYPSVITHLVSGVVDDTLRYKFDEDRSGRISHESKAHIIPFAQSEMVMRFMTGVDPDYLTFSSKYIEDVLTKYPGTVLSGIASLTPQERASLLQSLQPESVKLVDTYKRDMAKYRYQKEISPILDAVEALPKDDLALMAESLINLTSLKRRVSLRAETVGGAVDVAVISKGDGLIWIKRKHYFDPELNHQFFQNYYRKDQE